MAQIIKIACPECGHVHKRNTNRFSQKDIKILCRQCGVEFVFEYGPADSKARSTKTASSDPTPTPAPTARQDSQELEVRLNHVVRIYWAWMWRSLCLSALLGLLFGAGLGFVASLLNLITIQPLFTGFGVVIGIISGFLVLKKILKKNFRGFRIALLQS